MITFIIPAYQAEDTLRETIDSVLWQTDESWRMILVNDGSTDRTKEICLEYREQLPEKITYLSQSNKGLGCARNAGMALVKTRYMAFLDSDDRLMPNFVETIALYTRKHEPEVILTLPLIWHEGSQGVREWYDQPVFDKLFQRDGEMIVPSHTAQIYTLEVNVCRKILHRDFVRRTGFLFPESIKWEDVFPHFYLLSNCRSCMGIRSTGFYYRVGRKNQITALRGKDRLDILTIFPELLRYIEEGKREELRFGAMRLFVRFSIWCIKMTEGELRVQLVKELSSFFRRVPSSFYKALRKGAKNNYNKADRRQYALFLIAIRRPALRFVFYDYLYQEAMEKIVKKLLRAGERVG